MKIHGTPPIDLLPTEIGETFAELERYRIAKDAAMVEVSRLTDDQLDVAAKKADAEAVATAIRASSTLAKPAKHVEQLATDRTNAVAHEAAQAAAHGQVNAELEAWIKANLDTLNDSAATAHARAVELHEAAAQAEAHARNRINTTRLFGEWVAQAGKGESMLNWLGRATAIDWTTKLEAPAPKATRTTTTVPGF